MRFKLQDYQNLGKTIILPFESTQNRIGVTTIPTVLLGHVHIFSQCLIQNKIVKNVRRKVGRYYIWTLAVSCQFLYRFTISSFIEVRDKIPRESHSLYSLNKWTPMNAFNSERSEECIDFTMMCVFFFVFVSVYSITSQNNAPISNFGGGFRWKSEYPWCIIQVKS
ncbi:Uncharacterized protein FWK35_00022749 [Aphis craccivora]|uniref:Uncharacterized protein n=1 Tax=Aphis craccivora TaxID=307492 RepID=A0A6G0YKT8_APHCR|nr:Uncharacterized protein FWK35_00022749 [Aphis craccivora]